MLKSPMIRSYYYRYIFIARAAEVIGWLGSHKCSVLTTGFPSHLKPWVLVGMSGDVRGNCRDFRSVWMFRWHLRWQQRRNMGGRTQKHFMLRGLTYLLAESYSPVPQPISGKAKWHRAIWEVSWSQKSAGSWRHFYLECGGFGYIFFRLNGP